MNRITFGALAVAGLLAFAVPALANHSWSNYHWPRAENPLTLALGDNVGAAWDAHLATASSDWSVSAALNTDVVAGGTSAKKGRNTPKNCIPTAGRVEVCNAKYGANGWLGIAQVWITSDGHITQGTAKMNDTYFNTATYNSPAWRQLVVCQEVAHTFGLDHQDETFDNANLGTCMDYTNDPDGGAGGASAGDPSNEHPNAHDYAQLESIYAHLENLAVWTSLAPTNNPGNASEWGKAIRNDDQGRPNVFEKDLGDGNKVITHVFWAE